MLLFLNVASRVARSSIISIQYTMSRKTAGNLVRDRDGIEDVFAIHKDGIHLLQELTVGLGKQEVQYISRK